jgi:FAD-dependent urate hydroxylase
MPKELSTSLLIIGAGPYGLAVAASAKGNGLDYLLVGEPMSFWKDHMPEGMFLRSSWDWHLDSMNESTIEAFLDERGLSKEDVTPFSLTDYLDYCAWFQERNGLDPSPLWIERVDGLNPQAADGSRFVAVANDGTTVTARDLVIALGFTHFVQTPSELAELIPAFRLLHTHDCCSLAPMANKRCLIVGGRQSAYEWAALLGEAGAAEIHISHRHPCPAYAEADWSWVPPIVDGMIDNPSWYRNLPAAEKQAVGRRLWGEGRLKVEPWLEERIRQAPVTIWPETTVVAAEETGDDLLVELSNGTKLHIDSVILATGYQPELSRVPMLANGNLLSRIECQDGLPVLDEMMQCSVSGLYLTSMLAVGSFGPFFAFTVAARTSAALILRGLLASQLDTTAAD